MHEALSALLETNRARELARFESPATPPMRRSIVTGTSDGASVLTFYSARSKLLIYVEYADGIGWDVFVPVHDGNSTAETIAKLRAYLREPITPHNMREHSKRERER